MRLTLWLTCLLAAAAPALATETDQFTPPHAPLHDIGPQLSRKIVAIIEADRTGRDPDAILSRWIGHNVFASRLVRWVHRMEPVENVPVRFRPSAFGSIYRVAFSPTPASFWVDAPTVKIHGYYMGTDKIDHFFQQGHEYFEIARKKGTVAAIAHGVRSEHSYFGTLTTGVFSNADLAANYAGMKFYLNLQHPGGIGDRILPAMFERTPEGRWRLREGIDASRLLEPFLSDHLDESLNPSRYRFSRRSIRSAVQQRCDAWTQFYSDRLNLIALSGDSFASTWFGEEYGHWLPESSEISIATECTAAVSRYTPSAMLFNRGTPN